MTVVKVILLQQPAVFGVKVYDTDESTQVKESPTRKVHRKYGRNPLSSGEGELVEEEYFGTPTFFSEQNKEKDLAAAAVVPGSEQPVLQVLEELLNNNRSDGLSVKDLVNASKSHEERTKFGLSLKGGEETTPNYNNRAPSVYKHTQSVPLAPTRSPSPTTSPPRGEKEKEKEKEEGDAEYDYSDQHYKDKFKEIWPYRTDDKYSLFYFHPSKEEKESDEKEYPWPSLSEYEKEKYNFQPREPTKQENLNQEVAPLTTAGYDLSLLKIILNARVLKETTFIYFLRSRLSKAEKYERN